jgi:chorismate mutase
MVCRGIRGAITVESNDEQAILKAARELLESIVAANGVAVEDVVSVLFSVTPDLDAVNPARAAREMGWSHTPLLSVQEMAVGNGLPRCIRVLIHWNTDRSPEQVRHIYLGEARILRPDLVEG